MRIPDAVFFCYAIERIEDMWEKRFQAGRFKIGRHCGEVAKDCLGLDGPIRLEMDFSY